MHIAIGADHAGYALKEEILWTLRDEGHEVDDFGACSPEPVDYPKFAKEVGEAVRDGRAERGILICGSGVGVSVAANKVNGVRAGLCHDMYSAHQSVEHDNVNVLCLGPRVIGSSLALDLVHTWLAAKFTGEDRHVRRLAQVDEIERMEAKPTGNRQPSTDT
jgi:ribose 5-phosphate isomerase B